MNPMKKNAAGFYLSILTGIIGIASIAAYLMNCNSSYFSNMGVNPVILACMVLAVASEILHIVINQKSEAAWSDLLPVIAGVLFMAAFVMFISDRVAGIASIMTFEKNAENTASMNGAVIGMICTFAAAVFNMLAAFFPVVKRI